MISLAIAVLLALLAWYLSLHLGHWRDLFIPRKFRTIDAGKLYASGQINQRLIRGVLVKHHIGEIISLLPDDPSDPDVAAEIKAAQQLGIDRHTYRLAGDGTGNIREYAAALEQLVRAQQQGKAVLLHCSSGAQRSNAATYFYRVLIEHWKPDDAAREMFRNGHRRRRNPELLPYLNSNIGPLARILAHDGVIPSVPQPLPQISQALMPKP